MSFSISVHTHIDTDRLSRGRVERANEVLAWQVVRDTEQYVPALTGALSGSVDVKTGDPATITYRSPYARFLWEGKVMVDTKTGSAWARRGATKRATSKSLVFTKAMHGQAQSHWFDASKAVNLARWKEVYKEAYAHG